MHTKESGQIKHREVRLNEEEFWFKTGFRWNMRITQRRLMINYFPPGYKWSTVKSDWKQLHLCIRRGEAQHPAPTTPLSSISRSLTSTDWLYIYNQQMLWPKTSQTIEKCASKRHRCRTGQSHKKATITQKFNNHSIHINVTSISLIMQPKKIGFHSKWFTFDIIV